MSLRYLVWSALAPGNLLALALAVGALLALSGRRRAGRILIGIATLGFVLFLVLPLGRWAMAPLENRFAAPRLSQPADGILLLTGAINVGETLARDQPVFWGYAERITMTAALARRFPKATILISGGSNHRGWPSEASVHRDLLAAIGVDPGRIRLEERSRNTCESAIESKRAAEGAAGQRWLLVTSAFHLPRAVACFRHAGWTIIPYPAGYEVKGSGGLPSLADNLHLFHLALHEWSGLLAYRLMGMTDEIFPAPLSAAGASPAATPIAAAPQSRG
ncbi:MAG TPA: YdcF family protein [Stellaceae bacterium]|nr:YdcF family protein [Stellaceae bacterium]